MMKNLRLREFKPLGQVTPSLHGRAGICPFPAMLVFLTPVLLLRTLVRALCAMKISTLNFICLLPQLSAFFKQS